MQHVSILSTLEMLLNHEDVLCEIISPKKSKPNIYERFSEGEAFNGSNFWNETESMKLEIILYHDDFNVVNPLGNKTSKYKVSAVYFVLGNLPAKYRSRLTDIHLLSIVPTRLISKYGYEKVLEPLIKDLKTLETQGLDIVFEGKKLHFQGTFLSMVVCDNLAAHAVFAALAQQNVFVGFAIAKKTNFKSHHIFHITHSAQRKNMTILYSLS